MPTLRRLAAGLLLPVLYVLVVVPVGLVTRLVRDPLRRRPDRAATSYWITTGPAEGPGGRHS
ncbi:hypothetical protein SAMN06297387_107191 [Streptomyces zhaozhouensis]|uniref:Uncharacterized protein n=1 Tax=Streptomyces zhaozhouensis TaxID=1300267 RepID=A0A286DVW5_9ACTN|nr:hypothetical protein [Streptomyces zhaozhouensis]SOD62817.1 hypothetical protein SAMN06297387_107191 [Streptomyces zhaozhouensis]